MVSQRGIIRNEQNMKTASFSGLRWGNVTPTDIDCMIEFGNRLFVFVELKHEASTMPYGQQLALTRLCDAIERSVPCYIIAGSHSEGPHERINVAEASVTRVYHAGRWHSPKAPITVRIAIDRLRAQHNIT